MPTNCVSRRLIQNLLADHLSDDKVFSIQTLSPLTLRCYLDESSDKEQKKIFVASGFLASKPLAERIEECWLKRLGEDDIDYFRSNDCNFLDGPFKKFRSQGKYPKPLGRQAAEKIRADLEDILLSSRWLGFCVGIVLPDYSKVLKEVPVAKMFFDKDSTESAYYGIMYEIARSVRAKAPGHTVAYIVDQSCSYKYIAAAFKATKINQPRIGKTMETIIQLDDKKNATVQAADLLASVTKAAYFEWLKKGKPRCVPLPLKWRSHFEKICTLDEEYMRRTIVRNVKTKRFATGKLPSRVPHPHTETCN